MFDPELKAAMILKAGLPLPLDLMVELEAEGYIIADLEDRYFQVDTSPLMEPMETDYFG